MPGAGSDHPHVIEFKGVVGGHKSQTFNLCLRHQHAVERIPVVKG